MGIYSKHLEEKEVHTHLYSIASSSFIVLAGILASKGLTWLYRIVAARHFGAEAYGLFILSMMIARVFIVLSTDGFTEGVGRFIPFYTAQRKEQDANFYIEYLYLIIY